MTTIHDEIEHIFHYFEISLRLANKDHVAKSLEGHHLNPKLYALSLST